MSGGIGRKLTDKAIKAFVAKAQRSKKLPDGGGVNAGVKMYQMARQKCAS